MKDKTNQVDVAENAPEGEQKIKVDRIRSPNFPAIDLQKALGRAKELYGSYKGTEVPIQVVHEKWQYKPFSSNADQTVAALKAFGLIDIKGTGKKRTAKLSERAQKILGEHPDKEKLIQEAALNPTVFREIWEKYQPEGLPPDDALHTYLKWDRKFNPNYINSLIADFRNTLDFAKITATVNSGGEKSNPEATSGVGGDTLPKPIVKIPPPPGATLPQDRCDMATDTFTLEEGPVILQYPKALSSSSFEDFKAWTELQLRKIQRSIKNDATPAKEEPIGEKA
jgi:hypothetical protein